MVYLLQCDRYHRQQTNGYKRWMARLFIIPLKTINLQIKLGHVLRSRLVGKEDNISLGGNSVPNLHRPAKNSSIC